MSQLYISRSQIRKSLTWAATARFWLTLATALAVLAIVGLSFASVQQYVWLAVVAFFVAPLFVAWLVTQVLCPRLVECPACKGSLWDIGTGGITPGGVTIKEEVTTCPHCGAVMI